VKLIDDVMISSNTNNSQLETGAGQFAVSDSGHVAYVRGGMYPNRQSAYVWFDRHGEPLRRPVPDEKHDYGAPRLRPDGWILDGIGQTFAQDGRGILIYDPTRKSTSRVRFSGRVGWPSWTPDGQVVFDGYLKGRSAIFIASADGSGEAKRLTALKSGDGFIPIPDSWSADRNELLLWQSSGQSSGVFKLAIDSQSITAVLEPTREHRYRFPALSPDRRWLAYTSIDSGREEVWVTPYPSPGGRRKVSRRGGQSPAWTRAGTEIVYYESIDAANGRLMSVAFVPDGSLPPPVELFKKATAEFMTTEPLPGFAVTANGERFLAVVPDRTVYPTRGTIDVIFHWVETLPTRLGGPR
jgi:hypothetical protein